MESKEKKAMKIIYQSSYFKTVEKDAIPGLPYIKDITLKTSNAKWKITKPALIDSGADRSALPLKIVKNLLESYPTGSVKVCGIKNERFDATTIALECEINGIKLTKNTIDFVVLGVDIVIGRDILNKLHVCLDGLNRDENGVPMLTINLE